MVPKVPVLAEEEPRKRVRGKSKKYYSWAELLKRVFKIDIAKCDCGGTLKIKQAVLDTPNMQRILAEHGMGLDPPLQFFVSHLSLAPFT